MVLVYPLGQGSTWQNNEIRYSIRSAVKHFAVSGVIVIGGRLSWLDAEYVQCQDKNLPKMYNTTRKLQAAVNSDSIPERFVWMNDDFFFRQDMDSVPCLHKRTLAESRTGHPTKGGLYWHSIRETEQLVMEKLNINTPLDYSLHCPMVLEKQKVAETLELMGGPKSLLFRSVYGNHHRLESTQHEDMKLRVFRDMPKDHWPFFSTSDVIVRERRFTAWLESQYPEKSRFERGMR